PADPRIETSQSDQVPSAFAPGVAAPQPIEAISPAEAAPAADSERQALDRLPLAVLIYRIDRLIYANRALLDWTGHAGLKSIAAAGGPANPVGGPRPCVPRQRGDGARTLGAR